MQFGNSAYWWLLLILPALVLLCSAHRRRQQQALDSFSDRTVLEQVNPGIASFEKYRLLKDSALLFALALILLALLRPQWGFTLKPTLRSGVDIAVAVDVSQSMMAEDVAPNRLTRAKREIEDLLASLRGDRIALVAFAGIAFVECPLTLDYGAFRMFLTELSPDLLPVQGTDVAAAIREGIRALAQPSEGGESGRQKALLLITDGEDFNGDFSPIAAEAKKQSVQIYIVGIGTEEGAPIPTARGFKRLRDGTLVTSKLNEEALSRLALETGGVYVRSIAGNDDTKALYDLGIRQRLEAREYAYGQGKRWNEYYQFPLAIALLVLLTARIATLRVIPLSSVVLPYLLLSSTMVLFSPSLADAQNAEALASKGREAFSRGDFKEALSQFQAARESSDDPRYLLGEGAAQYRLGNFTEAKKLFLQAETVAEDTPTKAEALFNAGNSMVQLNDFENALAAFGTAIEHVPDDREARENLEYTKKLVEQQQSKQQDSQQNYQQDKQDSQNDKNQSEQQQSNQNSQSNQQQDQSDRQQSDSQQSKDGNSAQSDRQGNENEESPQEKNVEQDNGDQGNDRQQQKNDQSAANESDEGNETQPAPSTEESKEKDSSQHGDEQSAQQQESPTDGTSPEEKNDAQSESSGGSKDPSENSADEPAPGEASNDQQQGTGAGTTAEEDRGRKQQRFDQLEAQLETVQEGTTKLMEFRMKKGIEKLQEQNRTLPQRDW